MNYRTAMETEDDEPEEPMSVRERLAALEERMNTMYAKYETGIARLAEDMAKRDAESTNRLADLKSAMEQRGTEAAKRETRLVVTFIGVVFALMAAGFTIMTFMIRTGGTIP